MVDLEAGRLRVIEAKGISMDQLGPVTIRLQGGLLTLATPCGDSVATYGSQTDGAYLEIGDFSQISTECPDASVLQQQALIDLLETVEWWSADIDRPIVFHGSSDLELEFG